MIISIILGVAALVAYWKLVSFAFGDDDFKE